MNKIRYLLPIIVMGILLLSACSSANTDMEPQDPNTSEEMIFEPEDNLPPKNQGEVDSDEMIFEEDEIPAENDEMVFEDDEALVVVAGNIPPDGSWLWTNSDPIYEGCPVDMSNAPVPPDPPEEVLIEMSDEGNTMFVSAKEGAVELYQIDRSESSSVYEATIEIVMTENESLLVEYFLDYNLLKDGTINGTIVSELPAFDDCKAYRDFTAEYIGP